MKEIKTPCFILDVKKLESNINAFKEALSLYFPNNVLSFSVKTNSLPYLLKICKNNNCYAEVVSYDEYQLAILCGYSSSRIVYNGVIKSKETMYEVLSNNGYVNIDSNRELEWLEDYEFTHEVRVGIRVNINLNKLSSQDIKEDEDGESRFGFSPENEDLHDAIKRIGLIPNVRLSGLHLHRTSKTRSVEMYKQLSKYACSLITKYKLNLDYLDVGGGYYGDLEGKPSYKDYMEVIYEELKGTIDLDHVTLIVEPGNALIASPISYLSTVIDVRNVNNKYIVTTDGTRNDIDPLFRKNKYLFDILYNNLASSDTLSVKQVITGCTCLEFDTIFEITDSKQLAVGDQILYLNVGAYTMCLSPLFIRYIPDVYIYDNNEYYLIRDKWDALEYIQKSKL